MFEIHGESHGRYIAAIKWKAKRDNWPCGTKIPIFRVVDNKRSQVRYFCDDRITCKICMNRYSFKVAKRFENGSLINIKLRNTPTFADFMRQVDYHADLHSTPYFFTLTLQGRESDVRWASLEEQVHFIEHYWKCFETYYVRSGMPFTGFFKLETTWNAKNKWWHTHIHIVANNPRLTEFCNNDLALIGQHVTRIAKMCGFGERIGQNMDYPVEIAQDMSYLYKYCAKPPKGGFTEKQQAELKHAFKGKQLTRRFGNNWTTWDRSSLSVQYLGSDELDLIYDEYCDENPIGRYF